MLTHLSPQVFFVVLLQPPTQSSPLPATTDPDSLITCDLMDGRDAFLNLAREKHWEFSSLRRGKFSTQALLYELHNQGGDRFVYTCNSCRSDIETRWHCAVCEVSVPLCPLSLHPDSSSSLLLLPVSLPFPLSLGL